MESIRGFLRGSSNVDHRSVSWQPFLAASTQDMPCVGPHKGRERQMFLGGTKVLASRGGLSGEWLGRSGYLEISKVIP